MKRGIFLTILIGLQIVYLNKALGQSECGFQDKSDKEEQVFQSLLKQYGSLSQGRISNSTPIYVPVKIIFFANTAGVNPTDMLQINRGLARANEQFRSSNIYLYICGTNAQIPEIIANDSLNLDILNGTRYSDLTIPLLSKEAHNLIFLKSIPSGSGGYSYGSTQNYYYNKSVLRGGQATDGKIIAHEMGHWLSLPHTFRNSDNTDVSMQELVTRSFNESLPRLSANCLTQGDFICDTPADPYNKTGGGVSNCSSTGEGVTVTDLNGDAYTPMPTNIMSYYFCETQLFTAGQTDRMHDAYLVNNTPSSNNSIKYTLDCAETTQDPVSNLVAQNIHQVLNKGIQLTWIDNSNLETGYFIERAIALTGPYETITGVEENTTSYTDNDAQAGVTYFYRIRPSNSKAIYNTSIPSVKTNVVCSPNYSLDCVLGRNTDDLIIKDLEGNTLFQKLDAGCSPNNYGDFTTTDTLKLESSKTYNLTYGTGYGSGGYWSQHVGVFIDLNNDGDFMDANELVYQSTGDVMNGTTQLSDVIQMPDGDYFFPLRMRLRTHSESYGPVSNPCEGAGYGETDDYIITLTSCKETLELVNNIEGNSSSIKAKTNTGNINATNKIIGNARINYEAQTINLTPGFEVQAGSVFKANVGGCD